MRSWRDWNFERKSISVRWTLGRHPIKFDHPYSSSPGLTRGSRGAPEMAGSSPAMTSCGGDSDRLDTALNSVEFLRFGRARSTQGYHPNTNLMRIGCVSLTRSSPPGGRDHEIRRQPAPTEEPGLDPPRPPSPRTRWPPVPLFL